MNSPLKGIVTAIQKYFNHLASLGLSFIIMNTKVLVELLPFLQFISDAMQWEVLILSGLKQKDFHISVILNNMKQNCTMQHFDISYDNCFDEAIDLAVGIVNKSADILFVNLSSFWPSLENIKQILSQLQCISSLRHIDLSSNCINEQLVDQICVLLYNSVNMEHLNLSNCKVKASELLKIAQKLKCKTLATSFRYQF